MTILSLGFTLELVTRLAIKTMDQVLLPTGPAVRHQSSQPEWDFIPGWSLAVQDHRDNPVILICYKQSVSEDVRQFLASNEIISSR